MYPETSYELEVLAFCSSLSSFSGTHSEWVQELAPARSASPGFELRRYGLADTASASQFTDHVAGYALES